jgi:hypothetical protein
MDPLEIFEPDELDPTIVILQGDDDRITISSEMALKLAYKLMSIAKSQGTGQKHTIESSNS